MSQLVLTGCVLLPAACGGTGTVPEVASQVRAITGGTLDTGDPAVVALTRASGGYFCSGTIIDATHVLTAGHCVSSGAPRATKPAWICICPDTTSINPFSNPGCYLATKAAVVHPRFRLTRSQYLDAIDDIAVVELAAPTTIAPKPLPMTRLPASAVGTPTRVVGYGIDETGSGSGVKRTADAPTTFIGPAPDGGTPPNLEGLLAGMFQMTGIPGTCNGDSGGPAFWPAGAADEAVVGITSTGDAACTDYGIDTDVGYYLCWLASVGVAGAFCPDAGADDAGTPSDAGVTDAGGMDGGSAEGGFDGGLIDGGGDGGPSDGGGSRPDGGAGDASVADDGGSQLAGGLGRPGCGCTEGSASTLAALGALVFRRRARRSS